MVRTKHLCGDASDKAAGNEALALRAQVIAKAGDDVAFAGSESAEAGFGHFFCGFAAAAGVGRVAGEVMKFRLGSSRAKGANANTVWLHLFGKTFGQEEIKGFGCRVSGDIRDRLEGNRRGDDEHIAAPSNNHLRQEKAREVKYSGAVDLNHIEKALRVNGRKFAILAEAGIVDQEIDSKSLLLRELEDFVGSG